MKRAPNREFCGKCGRREAGGTGEGLRYRCPRCSALRRAALLASAPRNNAARRGMEAA